MLHHANTYDEGFLVSGAERLLRGQLPYRDFNSGYPPGQFYTVAAVFRVFGVSLLTERVWDVLWRLATVAATVGLVRAVRGRAPTLVLLCIGAWTGVITFHLYPMITGTIFCVCALWCCVWYLDGRGLRCMLLSGLITGLGLLYRHDLLLCIFGAVIAATVYQAVVERDRAGILGAAVFVGGVVAIFAPFALLIWTHTPHALLKQTFIDFPRITAGEKFIRFYVIHTIWDLDVFYLPLTILTVAAFQFWLTHSKSRQVLLLLWLAAAFTLAVASQRLDVPHVYPAIVLSLVLLSCCLAQPIADKPRQLPSGFRKVLLCAVLFVYAVPSAAAWVKEISMIGVPRDLGIARAGPIPLDADQVLAVRYIQDRIAPGEPLYVGTTSHSGQYMNDALFCFLTNRPQATRWDMWVPGITTRRDVQSEIAGELDKKRVEFVVLFAASVARDPIRGFSDNGPTVLDTAIRNRYREVARFGRYTILRRTSEFAPSLNRAN